MYKKRKSDLIRAYEEIIVRMEQTYPADGGALDGKYAADRHRLVSLQKFLREKMPEFLTDEEYFWMADEDDPLEVQAWYACPYVEVSE